MAMSEVIEHNKTSNIEVGACDYGPLSFQLEFNSHPGPFQDYSNMVDATLELKIHHSHLCLSRRHCI